MSVSYRNPIIPGLHPDPSICRAGEDYFVVNSSFEYFPGVPIFHSRDLVHWRQVGYCLTRESQLPLANARPNAGIFAPTIRYHEGTFYMITTNMTTGGNFYVTTKDPFGEWSDPVWVAQQGIDPSLFFDDDGKVYLTTTGHVTNPDGTVSETQGILLSEIDLASGRLLTKPRHIWDGTGGSYPEGPHLYKIDGRYYLMIAEGGTEYGHMETIARSSSPSGPWEPAPHNPIITNRSTSNPVQAVGHADLVQATDGSWWLVCLGIRPAGYPRVHHLGRETFLAPVTWDSDGWPHVGRDGHIDLEMPTPQLTSHPWEQPPVRDEFDKPALGLEWNFLGNPTPEFWSLTDRPGSLRLRGNSLHLDDGIGVAFLGRRQEHFNCEVATSLDYDPAAEGEEAGLSLWMNSHHHYDIFVSRIGGARHITVRARIGLLAPIVAQQPLPHGPVTLIVRADRYHYDFAFTSEGTGETALATLQARYLGTEASGGLSGIFFALFASAGAGTEATPAYFDWFEYRDTDAEKVGVETPLRDLLADAPAIAVLKRHLPAVAFEDITPYLASRSLIDLANMQPDQFPRHKLGAIAHDLHPLLSARS